MRVILLILVLVIGSVIILLVSNFPKTVSKSEPEKPKILFEKIPGSQYHSPDGTWWGYNQSKIARFEDKIFSYYIDNIDGSNKTVSNFVVLIKDGEKEFQKGASFPTSRPGNILVDSKGVLHVFVYTPTKVEVNDSRGKLIHYFFPNSKDGDITNYRQEIVVDGDETNETVNIRVGSAIGADDTMAISFGLTTFNPLYKGYSEHLYFKKPTDQNWTHLIAGENLGHDYYYPYTLVTTDYSYYLLPIQDDFNDDGDPKTYDNIYQKIPLFSYINGNWNMEMIVDLSNHPLAKVKPRLLEQEELMEDQSGNLHIIYKEFLDPQNTYQATGHWHLIGKSGNFKSQKIELGNIGANWVRLVDVDGELFYLISTFDKLFVSPINKLKTREITLPEDAQGFYPYVASSKKGSTNSEFVDILLLASDQKLYQEGKNVNYYLRIPKEEFKNK